MPAGSQYPYKMYEKNDFSLALGTFGLGMAEFGIMGVLPDMAHDVGISIPAAGNMIAWYAFGVVIGAPIMALLSSRFSLKSVMLFWLACVFSAIPCLPSPVATPCWRLAGWFPGFHGRWRRRDYPVENRAAGEGDRRGGGDDWRHDDR